MGVISVIGQLVKAMAENAAAPQNGQNAKQLPVEQLKILLKNGRKQDAVILLARTMNWSPSRSLEFVESLKPKDSRGITSHSVSPTRTRTATQIDAILREQRNNETNGGGSLIGWLLSKFKK